MAILNPSENITSIISMIKNAKKSVVIVSPYSDLTGWDNLKNSINEASAKKIDVHYYTREDQGSIGLQELNVKVFEVPMLHAKMFFSESEAIIGSFHLKNNKDINWGYKLNDEEEYRDLINFFDLYIKPLAKPFGKHIIPDLFYDCF
jgi:hypothetical protein